MGPRRRRIALLDAAVSLLGREGPRGLTHRAVDARAGVAEGSTSYYFRTRAELVDAVLEHLADLEHERIAQLTLDPDAPSTMLARLTDVDRELTIARFELLLEIARNPELRPLLERGRAATLDALHGIVTAAGSTDPDLDSRALEALFDGLLLHQLSDPDPRFAEKTVPQILDRFLASLGDDR
jgi:DNA-binding transcriptional regulator YbjK